MGDEEGKKFIHLVATFTLSTFFFSIQYGKKGLQGIIQQKRGGRHIDHNKKAQILKAIS